MSYLNTRNALLEPLLTLIDEQSTLLGIDIGIANENSSFDPDTYDIWAAYAFNPVTSESLGKGATDSDDKRGYMQVSIYVKQNSLTLYNTQLGLIDTIESVFYSTARLDNDVIVTESYPTNGRPSGGWYVRDLTINYMAIIQRG